MATIEELEERKAQLVAYLSTLHLNGETDPRKLYTDKLHKYDRTNDEFDKYCPWSNELLMVCEALGEKWAEKESN